MDYLLLRWNKHTPLWHGLPPLKMEQAYALVAWITSSYDGTSVHPCGMDYLLLRWNKHTPLWQELPSLKMEQAYTLVAWITFS
jgi:hypothetical protein